MLRAATTRFKFGGKYYTDGILFDVYALLCPADYNEPELGFTAPRVTTRTDPVRKLLPGMIENIPFDKLCPCFCGRQTQRLAMLRNFLAGVRPTPGSDARREHGRPYTNGHFRHAGRRAFAGVDRLVFQHRELQPANMDDCTELGFSLSSLQGTSVNNDIMQVPGYPVRSLYLGPYKGYIHASHDSLH